MDQPAHGVSNLSTVHLTPNHLSTRIKNLQTSCAQLNNTVDIPTTSKTLQSVSTLLMYTVTCLLPPSLPLTPAVCYLTCHA